MISQARKNPLLARFRGPSFNFNCGNRRPTRCEVKDEVNFVLSFAFSGDRPEEGRSRLVTCSTDECFDGVPSQLSPIALEDRS
jgi:hypothetical protein